MINTTKKTKPTRTAQTEKEYRRRTYELGTRCRKELKIPIHANLDYRRFVGWLIMLKHNMSANGWKQYKAAVIYFLETITKEQNDAIAQEALETLQAVGTQGCQKNTNKTSNSKMKKLPTKDFFKIYQYLNNNPHPWHQPLLRWLSCAILTGLRPREWAQCEYTTKNNTEVIVVENAKNTNGRAHGPQRTIYLDGLTEEERTMLKEHIAKTKEWVQANQFNSFYRSCAMALHKTVRKIWPKRTEHITLYSARHQFSANAKASGLTREEIAALMGHATDETATFHYGRKTAGRELIRVRPDPQEVAKIRKIYLNQYKGMGNEPSPQQVS